MNETIEELPRLESTSSSSQSTSTMTNHTNHPSHAHSHNPASAVAAASSIPTATTRVAQHGAATMTITETQDVTQEEAELLRLTLAPRPSVHWDENVLDNEGLGRKSSKRCCIFHKQRSFGESSTDSSDYDSDRSGSSAASGSGGDDKNKKPRKKGHRIARPKKSSQVPDFQRYHA